MSFIHTVRQLMLRNKMLHFYNAGICVCRCSSVPQEANHEKIEIKSNMAKQLKPPFAKNLFLGKFDADILTFPEVLEPDRLQALEELLTPIERYFSEEVDSTYIDASASIPEKNMTDLKALGLFGQQIPVVYGGLGLNATEYARVGEITSLDGSIAAMFAAHEAIGLKGILMAGTEEQKQRYLPRLASGEWIAAFCLAESDCPSDAIAVQTRATLSEDGKMWILNGRKKWISNGGFANLFTVIAKTEVEDHLKKKHDKLTAFLVERDFDGVSSGKSRAKLGIRGSNMCEVKFENTPVPVENVLGEVGLGFKLAMNILSSSRLCMGSSAAGILKKLIGLASEYAIGRNQFGKQLKDFDLIQEKFAKITCLIYAVESMTYLTAGMLDSHENSECCLEAAIVKVFCSEKLWDSISKCQEILGSIGYMKEYPYEQILRDSRVMASEEENYVLRMFIALTGLQYAGSILQETVEKLRNPLANPGFVFRKLFERRNHMQDTPNLNLGLDGYVHPSLQNSAKQLEYCVLRLQYVVELLLTRYGSEITGHQMELSRLADIVISIYAMTAVLGRASRSYCIGLQDSDYEVLVAATVCINAFQRVKINVKDIVAGPLMTNDVSYKKIAQKIFKSKGYFFKNPLTRNF